ncbi:hypothetical protein HanRHA438_Chr15g0714661 [Helianthus annuus]|nr:hypothetical protein HanRHA438_Chr15g0714661 [Helianthus annuus]
MTEQYYTVSWSDHCIFLFQQIAQRKNYPENVQLHAWQFYPDNQGRRLRMHRLQPEEAYSVCELI